jgi:hypothetical protein
MIACSSWMDMQDTLIFDMWKDMGSSKGLEHVMLEDKRISCIRGESRVKDISAAPFKAFIRGKGIYPLPMISDVWNNSTLVDPASKFTHVEQYHTIRRSLNGDPLQPEMHLRFYRDLNPMIQFYQSAAKDQK